jgi:hypothetical protein
MKIPYRLAQNPPQLARFSFSAALTPHLLQTDSHICEHGLYVWLFAAMFTAIVLHIVLHEGGHLLMGTGAVVGTHVTVAQQFKI